MLRAEDDVGYVPDAEFHPVIALQLLPLDTLPIHIGAVFASLVDYEKIAILRHNEGVIPGHARIWNDQVFVDLASTENGVRFITMERCSFPCT